MSILATASAAATAIAKTIGQVLTFWQKRKDKKERDDKIDAHRRSAELRARARAFLRDKDDN